MSRLDQLGTIAFDYSMMNKLIDFGRIVVDEKAGRAWIEKELDPSSLELSLWLQFIPDVFKDKVIEVSQKLFKDMLGCVADQTAKERFITSFQLEIDNAISKRELTKKGWKRN